MISRTWPEGTMPTPRQYREWLLALESDEQLRVLDSMLASALEGANLLAEAADDLDSGELIERGELIKELRRMALLQFDLSGPTNPRGAAFWDVAAWLEESNWPCEKTITEATR